VSTTCAISAGADLALEGQVVRHGLTMSWQSSNTPVMAIAALLVRSNIAPAGSNYTARSANDPHALLRSWHIRPRVGVATGRAQSSFLRAAPVRTRTGCQQLHRHVPKLASVGRAGLRPARTTRLQRPQHDGRSAKHRFGVGLAANRFQVIMECHHGSD
jgi:hypothetical protein